MIRVRSCGRRRARRPIQRDGGVAVCGVVKPMRASSAIIRRRRPREDFSGDQLLSTPRHERAAAGATARDHVNVVGPSWRSPSPVGELLRRTRDEVLRGQQDRGPRQRRSADAGPNLASLQARRGGLVEDHRWAGQTIRSPRCLPERRMRRIRIPRARRCAALVRGRSEAGWVVGGPVPGQRWVPQAGDSTSSRARSSVVGWPPHATARWG